MTSYGRALSLVTGGSLAVPVIGLVSAPILSHSLGAVGRGAVGAALAPNLLIVGGATVGLPAAITYFVSKNSRQLPTLLSAAALLTLPIALACVGVVAAVREVLSAGDISLGNLMVVGAVLAIPALAVGLLRGAAMAREMWTAVALEKLVGALLRLLCLVALVFSGSMSIASAFLTIALAPIAAGLVYCGLLNRSKSDRPHSTGVRRSVPTLANFGGRVWLGSVATVLFARSTDLFMTPLTGTEQLGLFLVAVTISDIPYILSQAVYGVLYSTSSASMNVERIARTARLCLLLSVVGSLILGATLPFWLSPIFGAEFAASTVPTWLLLAAASVAVPGLIVGAGIDASGRPGTRSIILLIGVGLNIIFLFLLAPGLGAAGAGIAGLSAMTIVSALSLVSMRKIFKAPLAQFLVPQKNDLAEVSKRLKVLTSFASNLKKRG